MMRLAQRLTMAIIGGSILVCPGFAFEASVNVPPICTQGCERLDVAQHGVVPNSQQDNSDALMRLLQQNPKNAVIYFPAGTYYFSKSIVADHLSNVRFEGAPGAVLRKSENFNGEYLFITRFTQELAFTGLEFHGLTTDRNSYHWGESGLYIGTSNGALVEGCRFFDIGDAAIRITSSTAGPQGVSSSNTIVRNNYFDNVTQVTTTSNKNGFGGSVGCWIDHNEFHNLKGSVKLATRMPGAEQVIITGNQITGAPTIATSVGIEVVGYSNVFIENNTIADTGGFAMNIYSNPGKGVKGFDWGNYLVQNNKIENCLRGIRVSAQAFSDNYKPKVHDINILNNTIHVKKDNAIQVQQDIQGVKVEGNNT